MAGVRQEMIMPTTAARQRQTAAGDFSSIQISYDRLARGEISHEEARSALEAAWSTLPEDPLLLRLIYRLFPSLQPENK